MQTKYNWEDHEWKTRTEIISKLVPDGSKVLDMGGGKEHLKKYLRSPKLYKSVDIIKCTRGTVVADLNKEYPVFKTSFDIVIAQGLIEYLESPALFFENAHTYASTLIVTYLEVSSIEAEEKGRVTTIRLGEFRKMLNRSGWKILRKISYTPTHHIYLCNSSYGN